MRRAACLLPLLVLILAPAPHARGADGAERVRFPAEVPPRNDILLDNRVAIPMRDGVTLYADVYRPDGGWRLSFNFGWGPVRQESRIMQNPGPHTIPGLRAIHYDEVQRHLPLATMQQLVGRHATFYDDWLAHPDYDAFWKPLNVEEVF